MTNKEYKCPYCNKKCKSDNTKFLSWINVRSHTRICKESTGEYFIDQNIGSLHYTEFLNTDSFYIKAKYPNLKATCKNIKNCFKKRNINIGTLQRKWDKNTIIKVIRQFYRKNSRLPQTKDWELDTSISGYPNTKTVQNHFGSWNKAIKAAGFEPNLQNSYGINTYGLDKHLYRSRYEAKFCDKFLFKQYDYNIEPKYPKPYEYFYDWYIEELDLYIELDGGLRPERIKKKIEINKNLNRKLLVVSPSSIRDYNNLQNILSPSISSVS